MNARGLLRNGRGVTRNTSNYCHPVAHPVRDSRRSIVSLLAFPIPTTASILVLHLNFSALQRINELQRLLLRSHRVVALSGNFPDGRAAAATALCCGLATAAPFIFVSTTNENSEAYRRACVKATLAANVSITPRHSCAWMQECSSRHATRGIHPRCFYCLRRPSSPFTYISIGIGTTVNPFAFPQLGQPCLLRCGRCRCTFRQLTSHLCVTRLPPCSPGSALVRSVPLPSFCAVTLYPPIHVTLLHPIITTPSPHKPQSRINSSHVFSVAEQVYADKQCRCSWRRLHQVSKNKGGVAKMRQHAQSPRLTAACDWLELCASETRGWTDK